MKKLFLLLTISSIFLMTSCELISGKNDDNNSSGGGSGGNNFLVITNDSLGDKLIRNIQSVGARSAATNRQFVDFRPADEGPKFVDVNINSWENVKKLEQSLNRINYTIDPNSIDNTIAFSFASEPAVGSTKNFKCFDLTNSIPATGNNYVFGNPVFTLKANKTKCRVWVKNGDGAQINDTAYEALANTLNELFDHEMAIFGSNEIPTNSNYINTNNTYDKKLNVLVYDIEADGTSTANKAYIGGLFYSGDLVNSDQGNACECIHVDSYYLKKSPGFIKSTLVHEFQHMLNFINKYIKNHTSYYETWFTEMLSMSAEDIFQTQIGVNDSDSPKARMSTFNSSYFDGFRNWRDGNDVLKSYANAYAFGAYLMRNYGGVKLIHQIATNNYINEAAITAALQQLGFSEDFYSVLHKFENVIVYPDADDKPNLNKSVTEVFSGVTYNLTAIPLMNYLTVIREDQKSCYYDIDNRYYSRDGNAYVRGPVILNNGYYHNNYLGSAGTYVLYFGGQTPMIIDENGLYQRVLER